MQRKIITTADGSKTIYLPEWNEHYHSKHGAIQEANHVFIEKGLFHVSQMSKRISILEMGFGTGLNALITFLEAKKLGLQIDYTGVEAYPVGKEEMNSLNYAEHFNDRGIKEVFKMLHDIPWQERNEITNNFSLTKRKQFFFEITDEDQFDLIYFDAFGPRVQPELWTKEIFKKMFLALKHNGVLVTYSAKGSVRRNMLEVGFAVERLPGPPGKREMLRATA
ncbi:MAG: tRNA (5-methylaminomethyl-2-thiouridine)(34)-methyltransferase MnmD [Bacteroidia bacterium]|nr:tRNA (5-methylaminomethyl-2-thiouridine)(34)-methyltransferase MnmD [Bacteroidia bacterium]MBT8310849.1 tRNA (5-methylaminomethyl-2-thiouridine)(34)-methyltransferase MnmD [Bacteroidia bacterium]NND10368.1 tRNA (5-methylaminomethyl-2-thiouridine)(34)-methyltransferase MnmD [Flavobacteriaceae bacterium]NNL60482.1 tRNA (5-methylaminomethyl-2-thiouridine)(34)-methyltransferase MnmD [Flavobacteriaceae bacterium]RZV59150.1 MAG: SAM-dependent methyltransferase [Flavobacteriaceae bacterium]